MATGTRSLMEWSRGMLASILLLMFLLACSAKEAKELRLVSQPKELQSSVSSAADLLTVNTIYVDALSFSDSLREEPQRDALYSMLTEALARETAIEILGLQDFEESKNVGENTNLGHSGTERPNFVTAAQKKGADAVLETRVINFVERAGSRLGTEKAAQVFFTFKLIRLSDNKEVWKADYQFRDLAISENVFRLPSKIRAQEELGPGWKEAGSISQRAFRLVARDIAEQRSRAFGLN